MKALVTLIAALAISRECFSQVLPDAAFDQMIVQDITYAIVGENTPVSGLKVDITKPEATVSGVFQPKNGKVPWSLFSFDFKGGITDKTFSLFKGDNSFNTAFEIRPSFHFIPSCSWNSAKYGLASRNQPEILNVQAKNKIVEANQTNVKDTFYAIALFREQHLRKAMPKLDPLPEDVPAVGAITENQKKVLLYFIEELAKKTDHGLTSASSSDLIIAAIPVVPAPSDGQLKDNDFVIKMVDIYHKYLKLHKKIDDESLLKIVNNASEIWTKKRYLWFTISPFARTEKANEYYTKYEGKDSLFFKSDYRFYYGVAGYANHYIVYPNKVAHLVRLGATLSHNSNMANLTSFNYETRTPFFSQGPSATEKTKSGTAYNNDDIKIGTFKQIVLEYYLLPLKSFVPGIYASANLNHSKLNTLANVKNRDSDKTMVGLEGGLVFNVNSREKDKEKSILSILFYARYEDLTDKVRTSVKTGLEESLDDFRKRNFSIGIRVGVPINLPQRTN